MFSAYLSVSLVAADLAPLFCGSWLACDPDTSVNQAKPVDAIAGEPVPKVTRRKGGTRISR